MNQPMLDLDQCYQRTAHWFDGYVSAGNLPGAAVAVSQTGRGVITRVKGHPQVATDKALVPDHAFQVQSMTKPLTAAACMLLVESGKLALDAPIARHLPEFQFTKVLRNAADIEDLEDGRPITLRHLLSHCAGFAHPKFDESPLRAMYHSIDLPVEDGGTHLADTVACLARLPFCTRPERAGTMAAVTLLRRG